MILKNIKDIEPDKILIKKPYTFYFVEVKGPEVSPDDIFYTFSGNFIIKSTDTFISVGIIREELYNKELSLKRSGELPLIYDLQSRYMVCEDVKVPIMSASLSPVPIKQIKVKDHFEIYVYYSWQPTFA